VADQAADKTSRREYRIQAGNMLLDGMRPLSQNQVQENET
jgi:hypothetical protein